jgi:mRNA-degrading endonuclease toxin of MazEF toxin-antitoxin module
MNNDTFTVSRGMVFFIDLGVDNKNGTMFSKRRPCVVISDNEFNTKNPKRCSVAPITSRENGLIFEITEVLFNYKGDCKVVVVSGAMPISIYDINPSNYAYSISLEVMDKIDRALKVHYGLAPVDILDVTYDDVTDYGEYKEKMFIEGQREIDPNSNFQLLSSVINSSSIKMSEDKRRDKKINNFMGRPMENNNQKEDRKIGTLIEQDKVKQGIEVFEDPIEVKETSKVSFRKLSQSDIAELKKRRLSSWTDEECLSFLHSLNFFNNGEMSILLGIQIRSLYRFRWEVSKRLSDKGIDITQVKIKKVI